MVDTILSRRPYLTPSLNVDWLSEYCCVFPVKETAFAQVPQIFYRSLLLLRMVEIPSFTCHKPEMIPWSRRSPCELASPLWLHMLGLGLLRT